MSGASPIAAATTGGPATNSWAVPRTITEKCEAATRAAPSPATGPSAAATTGTTERFSTTSSQPGTNGTYVKPIVSRCFTLPPPPVPSTSRTSGIRMSCAIRSAKTIFCQMAASAAPPRTVKSSPCSDRAAAVDPALADDHVRGQEVGQLAVLVVGPLPGDRAGLVERAGVEQPLDALAHGQPAGLVLARDALLAAHPPRKLLAAAQFL